jgi:hypothetical protein
MSPNWAFWYPQRTARIINSLIEEQSLLKEKIAEQTFQSVPKSEPISDMTIVKDATPQNVLKNVVPEGMTPHEQWAHLLGWRMPTVNLESMKLLASGDTRLSTEEIIALYTGWRICDAIPDKEKARRIVENANSWLPKINQQKISENSQIAYLMAAMLTLRDANAVKSNFNNYVPVSDQLFVTMEVGTTFYEANMISGGKYFISRDIRTSQLWAFELPERYFGPDGNEIDIVKEISGKQKSDISAVMTTPLGNVKGINARAIKTEDLQKLGQNPGACVYVLDIDPSAWRTFIVDERNSEATGCSIQYDENGRLTHYEGETGGSLSSPFYMQLSYRSVSANNPRPSWLGLLVAGKHYDNYYAHETAVKRSRVSDKFIFSAAHPQSLPMDVIIDTGKLSRSRSD